METDRISRFIHWKDAQLSLFGKLLVAHGLNRYGYPVNAISEIQRDKYNKPFIRKGPHFNISHAGDYVVCAMSNELTIGVDIEHVVPIDIGELKNQMSDREWERVASSSDRLRSFYTFWSRKEAIMKAHGKGLYIAPRAVDTSDAVVVCEENWLLTEVSIDEAYVCYVASPRLTPQVVVEPVNLY